MYRKSKALNHGRDCVFETCVTEAVVIAIAGSFLCDDARGPGLIFLGVNMASSTPTHESNFSLHPFKAC